MTPPDVLDNIKIKGLFMKRKYNSSKKRIIDILNTMRGLSLVFDGSLATLELSKKGTLLHKKLTGIIFITRT